MMSPGHFQLFNYDPDEKPRQYYKPRVLNLIFCLALTLFIAQGCGESGQIRLQLYAIEQGPCSVKSVEDHSEDFIDANAFFAGAFNPVQEHDSKGSEADGTLVIKASGEHSRSSVFKTKL